MEAAALCTDLMALAGKHGLYIIVSACCVCGKPLGVKDGQGTYGISHGYCPECKEAEFRRFETAYPLRGE